MASSSTSSASLTWKTSLAGIALVPPRLLIVPLEVALGTCPPPSRLTSQAPFAAVYQRVQGRLCARLPAYGPSPRNRPRWWRPMLHCSPLCPGALAQDQPPCLRGRLLVLKLLAAPVAAAPSRQPHR
eukprot:6207923-Pleurochrysis_carterae.AAC.2